ncbi:hypothetical protein ILUMI_13516 [Ignelater luminosus]|uniref:Uncharacterized protein n=1 Tax=Ignelater luminosus TaxID=2038154 RepID=A0A8K0CS94_IGNLU|nr:hypothetical protein ILUMI_13516 [Ignelater luminosus]
MMLHSIKVLLVLIMTFTALTIINGQHHTTNRRDYHEPHVHRESQPEFTLRIRSSDSGEDEISIEATSDIYTLRTPIIGKLIPRINNATFN